MTLSFEHALSMMIFLNGLACLIQSAEYFGLRKQMSETGVWRWSALKPELKIFPPPFPQVFESVLKNPTPLIILRLVASAASVATPSWAWFAILFISTLLIAIRFRGTFNGGSDFMTLIVNGALAFMFLFPEYPKFQIGCFYYIAVQSVFSYFIAGYIKIKRPKWQKGTALLGFINNSLFGVLIPANQMKNARPVALILSWTTMIFELLFPLALFNTTAAILLTSIAAAFHIINFYVFGLNRFVFAWISTYPAIYFLSSQ